MAVGGGVYLGREVGTYHLWRCLAWSRPARRPSAARARTWLLPGELVTMRERGMEGRVMEDGTSPEPKRLNWFHPVGAGGVKRQDLATFSQTLL